LSKKRFWRVVFNDPEVSAGLKDKDSALVIMNTIPEAEYILNINSGKKIFKHSKRK